MNVILLGSSVARRDHFKKLLRGRICPYSYTFHSKDKLTSPAWTSSTRALIIVDGVEVDLVAPDQLATFDSGWIYRANEDADLEPLIDKLNKPASVSEVSMSGCVYCLNDRTSCLVTFDAVTGNVQIDANAPYLSTFDFNQLKCFSTLCNRLIHLNCVTSTMDYFNSKNNWSGVAVIADRQTSGKGRKSNEWISPPGCLALTFGFPLDFVKAEHPAAVQHIIAIALVEQIRAQTKSDKVTIKWPNDIYWKDELKLGGLLTKSSIMGSEMIVCCGIGLNLTNQKPLPGIELLTGQVVTREELFGGFLERLETKLKQLANGSWRQDYYRLWSTQINSEVKTYDGKGTISGLDEDGFLLVKTEQGLKRFDTDNNSFDLMQGLISRK